MKRRTKPSWSFVQHNHIRRRNPEYAGGYCRFLSGLTYEQAKEVRVALQLRGISSVVGTNLLADEPVSHILIVHQNSDFRMARAIAENVLSGKQS